MSATKFHTHTNPRIRIRIEKPTVSCTAKHFRHFMEPESSFCVQNSPPNLPIPILSQINQVHAPPSIYWKSILILFFHIFTGLPNGPLPSGFPTKTQYALLLSPHLLHASPISWLHHAKFRKEYKSWSSSLCYYLHSPVSSTSQARTSSSETLFSNTLSPSMWETKFNTHKQVTGKSVFLYNFVFIFLDSEREN